MTDTSYKYVIIEEEFYVTDISVNPLDCIIFYCAYNQNNGRIMKASQDGSEQTLLRYVDNGRPLALTIDLVLRKVFWIDSRLNTVSSIDFDGNNFLTFGTHESNGYIFSMQILIYNNYIYWIDYDQKSILKTKLGFDETQMYLITLENNTFESFKIIDSSLQPNSTNRCINHNCSHICIPISINQYRCVCPKFRLQNDTKICTQSVCTVFITEIYYRF
jgi:low density lipoprotein-related protein 2